MTHRRTAMLGSLLLVFAAGWLSKPSAQAARRYVNPSMAADSAGPAFSGAVLAGDTLYLSGQLGVTRNSPTTDTPAVEASKVLTNVADLLRGAQMTVDDLVVVQVFCSDVAHYDAFNGVYRKMFKKELPARAFIGAGKLLFGARFEVQGIAVKR